jgi:hypothetical protein
VAALVGGLFVATGRDCRASAALRSRNGQLRRSRAGAPFRVTDVQWKQPAADAAIQAAAERGRQAIVPFMERKAMRALVDDFLITPPIIVKDTPQPRWLMTIEDARDYVAEAMRLGRPAPWRELWHRLTSLASEDEAIEAIGDLRELLEDEDLLLPDGG